MSYLLSIIIPTKNRFQYCVHAIESCFALGDDVQIVIQDNSDNSNEKAITGLNKQGNIKYNYHPGILSFVDNFSEGIQISDGQYVCMIGDDDAVLPNIVNAVKFMIKNDCDALLPSLTNVYIWPSDNSFIKNGKNGYLCLELCKKNKQKIVNPSKELRKLMKKAGQGYQELGIPRIYHGIVKRNCLEMLKEKTGHYFGGLTPDIYNAVGLSHFCKKVIRVSFPITVSGICPTSGSANSATGKHTGRLEDAPHFVGHKNYVWNNKVPEIYSVESIWAETVLKALEETKDDSNYNLFNVCKLDTLCLSKYPQFKSEIISHAKKENISICVLKIKKTFVPLNNFLNRIFKKINRIFEKKVYKEYNIKTIKEAIEFTMERMNDELN